jgi:hypothetical protein
MADAAILSNISNLAMSLDFGEGAGIAAELWFSPPGQMPLGGGIGVASMNGELFSPSAISRSSSTRGARRPSRRSGARSCSAACDGRQRI